MDRITQAFNNTPRQGFLPADMIAYAALDQPLPLGYGQTISQPTTVKRMLRWLNVKPGDVVLDLGSGSGWTTALLSRLVGPNGFVHAVERVPELVQYGRQNCDRLGITNVKFHQATRAFGLPQHSPFNRILVSAAAPHRIPAELLAQIADLGRMVIPVDNDILTIKKNRNGVLSKDIHRGYVFVPLLSSLPLFAWQQKIATR